MKLPRRVICGLHSSRVRDVSGRHRQPRRRRDHSHTYWVILPCGSAAPPSIRADWCVLLCFCGVLRLFIISAYIQGGLLLPVCAFIASASSSALCDLRCHWFPSGVPLLRSAPSPRWRQTAAVSCVTVCRTTTRSCSEFRERILRGRGKEGETLPVVVSPVFSFSMFFSFRLSCFLRRLCDLLKHVTWPLP